MKATLLSKLIMASGLLLTAAPSISIASVISSNIYVTDGGEVTAYFEGTDALFDSLISVNGSSEFFPNHTTSVGTAYNLGTFSAGTLLTVKLNVLDTGNGFYTGPAANNPDGLEHARIIENWNGTGRTFVGFEDIWGGGDLDYDDHRVSFSNTQASPVPVPAAAWLLGSGLLGLVGVSRRKAV